MRVDGHAHLHPSHSLESALDAAAGSFGAGVHGGSAPDDPLGMLWLVETASEGAAERLRGAALGRWNLAERDALTWELRRSDGVSLVLVRGRQVATSEGLEVLLVGTAEPVPDGRPLHETVEAWLDREVLVMLPWGFGKWTGSRGRLVSRAHDTFAPRGLRLADTGLRPGWWPTPQLLRSAARDGYPVFVGSDPLPFADQARSIGSIGFELEGVPRNAVWADLYPRVRDMRGSPSRFGSAIGALSFLTLQTRMQLRKHFGGRRA